MPSPTAAYVDTTGIHAPTYAQVLAYFQAAYQGIYGVDTYLGNDSQDGQLLAVFALAVSDANSAAFAVYNAYSPATAQGVGLSSVVKINGIAREIPTQSTIPLLIVGDPGTIITNGYASDQAGVQQWFLPTSVIVPSSGQITVQGTSATLGAVTAATGTIVRIGTPTRGWQTVTNSGVAVPGNPVEFDGNLRLRQASSTMLPSITASEGLVGAVESLLGVTRLRLYENDTAVADINGIPSHSIALVVEGGSPQAIANAIASKKNLASGTFGTTSLTVVDTYGVPNTIRYFIPTSVPITILVKVTPLLGYTVDIGNQIVAAVVAYINALSIGNSVILTKLYVPANLTGINATTFNISSITIARGSVTPTSANIPIAFNEVPAATSDIVSVAIG